METGGSLSYYVTVRLNGITLPDPYLCPDLSVRVGDEVFIRTENGTITLAKVVSAGFFGAEGAPCPPEDPKTVICRIRCDSLSERTASPVGTSEPAKNGTPPRYGADPVRWEPNHDKKPGRSFDLFAALITMLIFLPKLELIGGLIAAVILFLFGWDGDGGLWLPLILALPFVIVLELYAIMDPDPVQPETPVKHRARSGRSRFFGNTSGTSADGPADGGWYPGCPEDKMFSSMDSAFDYDGDGRLNDIERAAKYDVFFEDDE